jgi:sortase A
MRTVLRSLSTVLIVAGVLLLVDAVTTLVWQEPITALTTTIKQDDLSSELNRLRNDLPPPVELRALHSLRTTSSRVAFAARSWDRHRKAGDPVGRIEIPKIGASFVIVKGTDPADLREGPGIYDNVPFPGAPGTTAIAGHRTTYLAPFRHIDDLKPRNRIIVKMPYATLTYAVERTKIVSPTDLAVIARAGFDRLVLTACHPLFSAAQRIVVFARLVQTVPKGVAAQKRT